MKRIIISVIVVVLILAVAVFSKLNKQEQFAAPVSDPVVEVASPDYGDVIILSSVVGTIKNEETVTISLKAGGDVMEVYVKAGDHVEEGQLLFTIDTEQVETAKNTLDSAELALSQAKSDLARQEVLYAGGGISSQTYEQYRDAVKSAEITYSNAEIAYNNQLSYSNVTTPIAGTVETVNVEKLDNVSQGFEACVISGGNAKNVEFSVSERVVKNLSLDDDIELEKDGVDYHGKIIEISTMVDETTGLFDVKARLDEDTDTSNLPTGSLVKLTLTSEKSLGVMRIPVDAVYYEGGLSYVYTYDEDGSILHEVVVETGLYNSDYIEIISGLSESDRVLITWTSELYEGVKVKLKGEIGSAAAEEPEEAEAGAE